MASPREQLQCYSCSDYVVEGSVNSDDEAEDEEQYRYFQSDSSPSSDDDVENFGGYVRINDEDCVWKYCHSNDEREDQECESADDECLPSDHEEKVRNYRPSSNDEVRQCLQFGDENEEVNYLKSDVASTSSEGDGRSDEDRASPPTKKQRFSSSRTSRGRPMEPRIIWEAPQSLSDGKKWTDVTLDDSLAPKQFGFRPIREPGPQNVQHLQSSQTKAVDIFKLFFSEALLGEIVAETNRYARKKQASTPCSSSSRLQSWHETTCDEMYVMLALLMNMGTIRAPSIREYWTTKFYREVPLFRKVMPRNRFQLLFHTMLSCCYVDSENRIRGDRIQPLVDKLNVSFQRHFQPYREVSADETMIGFKGRLAWKQYNPKKPTRWGLLVRTLADARTGYLLNMKAYYGKTDGDQLPEGITKTGNIVIDLMKPYKNQGYHVFCDRLYCSLALGDHLALQKTHLTGTIGCNSKNIPKSLPNEQGSGQRKAMRRGRTMVLSWCHRRPVYMVSTFHRGDLTVPKIDGRQALTVHKPLVIDSYNKYMCGVDLSDQYSQHYSMARKSIKWWKKIFFWLLETSITNSYILYKLSSDAGKNFSLLNYRDTLVQQLLLHYENVAVSRGKRSRPSASDKSSFMKNGFHAQRKTEGRAKECKYCSGRGRGGKRKDTRFYCDTCVKKPGLHAGDCFTLYHSELLQPSLHDL